MKKISKLLALLLCLSLLFGTFGAGAAFAGGDESVVGTWVAKVDIIKSMALADPETAAIFGDEPIYFDMYLIFEENGVVKMDVDLAEAIPALKSGMAVYLTETIEQSYGMSIEDFESTSGMTLDELLEEAFSEETLEASLSFEDGTYTVSGNQVTINGDAGQTFTLSGDTLTAYIEEFGGDLVFTRVGGETRAAEPAQPAEAGDNGIAGTWAAEIDLLDILYMYDHPYSEFYDFEDFDFYGYYITVYLLLGEDGSYRAFSDLDVILYDFRTFMAANAEIDGGKDPDEYLDEEYHLSEIQSLVASYLDGKSYELSGDKLIVDGSPYNTFLLEDGELVKEVDGFWDIEFIRIPAVAGNWVAKVNLQKYIEAWVDEDMAKYIDADATFDLVLNVTPFGRYTASARTDEILEIFHQAFIDYAHAEHEDEIPELEEEYGMPFEDIVKEELNAEYVSEDLFWAMNWSSYYEMEDDNTISTYIVDEPLKLDGDTLTAQDADLGELVFQRTPGVVGKWSGKLDIAKVFASAIEDLADRFEGQSCEVRVFFAFTEDGRYTCTVDFADSMEDLKPVLAALVGYIFEQQGMTIEEVEELTGMTLDELIEQSLTEDVLAEMVDAAQEGTYVMIGTLFFMDDNYDVACYWDGRDTLLQTMEGFGEFVLTRVPAAAAEEP